MSWQTVALDELCEINVGKTPSRANKNYWSNGTEPWLSIADMTKGFLVTETKERITKEAVASCNCKIALAGTVLMSFKLSVGKVSLATFPVYTNEAIAALPIKNKSILCEEYLAYALKNIDLQSSTDRAAMGLTLNKDKLKRVKIPLPSLLDQKRIAAILDKADDIKSKREKAIAKLDELAQSTFIEMFGDPRNNEKKYPLRKIGELVSDFRGGAALKPEDFVDAGFPILHKGAIKQNGNVIVDGGKKTFATHEYAASKGANIINREYLAVTLRDLVPTGPSIGLVASMQDGPYDEYLLAQGAYGFKVDKAKLTAEYFVQLSNMPNFRHVLRQFAVGSTQIHIRTPVYQEISIPVPPISLQNKFSELMRKQQSIRKDLVDGLERHANLMRSLQHQAFTIGFAA